MPAIDRRRFLTIAAACAGAALVTRPSRAAAAVQPVVWHGQAMGAQTTLILNHPDPARAQAMLRQVGAELERLEGMFSLYRAGSALSELNRTGVLVAPAPEMVDALRLSRQVHDLTGGRFDPTIQPLFVAYAQGAGPEAVARARGAVGLGRVHVGDDRIAMPRGMALTLNGVAQGLITDRITDLLRAQGAEHTLVDMGEVRAIGGRSPTEPWSVALSDGPRLALVDRALAVTEAAGFTFDAAGHLPHLIDPATGTPRSAWRRLAVIAPQAGLADALSTGLSLAPEATIRAALAALPGVQVHALDPLGNETRFG